MTGGVGEAVDVEITEPDPLPVACTLGPDDGRSRLLRWQRLRNVAAPVAQVDGGRLEVRYQPRPGVEAELRALAAAEQTCCSFVTWTVSVIDERVVLGVSSPPGLPEAVAPIAALFDATGTLSQ